MTDPRTAQAAGGVHPDGDGAVDVGGSVGRLAALVATAFALRDMQHARPRLLRAAATAIGVEGCIAIDGEAATVLAERCRALSLVVLDVQRDRSTGAHAWLPAVARSALFLAMPDGDVFAAWSRVPRGFGAIETKTAEVAATLVAQLTPRRKDEGRARFLAVIAHDLRTPVTAIAMTAESLLRANAQQLAQERVQDAAKRIQRASRRMSALLTDLLDFERLRVGGIDLQVCDHPLRSLIEEVEETMRPLAEAKGLALSAETHGRETLVPCDRARLVQLLSNLVQNAIKFTPEGGTVELSAEAIDAGARFVVADTGPGMAPEQVARIFDPYWQARNGDARGLGLGLAIARGIAEAHGARIDVASAPGHGSKFAVTFPWQSSGSGRFAVPIYAAPHA